METTTARGVTLLEVLVAVGAVFVLLCIILPIGARARGEDQRSRCGNNCGNVIKCCHLYSDAAPNLGRFPIFVAAKDHDAETGDGHTQNGRLAASQLFDSYVKDHGVLSCPGRPTDTSFLKPYVAPKAPKVVEYTHYGYDPGHTPTHATAGIFGDLGDLNDQNANSMNHGREGPGQNIAIGAGSVEWWGSALRATKDANNDQIEDDIHKGNISPDKFPEELETHLVK
jgi:hypothetical protein